MPRGGGRGKVSHKGRRRHFTSEDELRAEQDKERRQKEWREKQGIGSDDEDEKGAEATIEEEDEDEEEEGPDKKGVASIIAVENPNRVLQKTKKMSELDSTPTEGAQLSRREREEIEKQQAKEKYMKMHLEGKTDEAKADLARLAIIRKDREEAAKKRDEAKKAKEAEAKVAATAAAEARKSAGAAPSGGRRRGRR